ncbi:M56 family metallopeptidase [Pendulispora brunnea]|uniref:M56 family metallopeptidase n=1 Tax=Pendulispora brunnea TaxID=2905690 RepID=A0ABZ2KH00_9BACT
MNSRILAEFAERLSSLTLATWGFGVLFAWVALAVCGFVVGIPLRKGRPQAAPASPSFRYRTAVVAFLGSAAMAILPSIREMSGGVLQTQWQTATWSKAAPLRDAAEWARPLVTANGAWDASPIGRALAAVAMLWAFVVAIALARALFLHAKLTGTCRRAFEAPSFVHARAAIIARRLTMPVPALFVSDETDVPFATGVLAPRVVLPRAELDTFSTEQLDFVLHHEMVHIQRGDLRVAFLVGVARILFTGHPMKNAFLSEIAWAREASVDARVAADSPLQYAAFLLELAQRTLMQSNMKGTVPMADSNLSRRIALLLSRGSHAPTRGQRRALVLLALAGSAFAACLWLAPTSWASQPQVQSSSQVQVQPVHSETLAEGKDGGCQH